MILHIIREAHLKTKHRGVKDTFLEIRSQYWLIQGRQVVKYFIGRYVLCQRLKSKVTCSFAFESSDADYLGPIYVKQVYNQYDNPPLFKAEIVLYTCAGTRAVQFDLVPDLWSTSFIQSLKHFMP